MFCHNKFIKTHNSNLIFGSQLPLTSQSQLTPTFKVQPIQELEAVRGEFSDCFKGWITPEQKGNTYSEGNLI